MSATSPSGRPVRTVLEPLRPRIELDRFDAAVLELEAVAADLGYGDVRALSGAVAWIDHLREHDKRIAPTVTAALAEIDVAPARAVAVAASTEGVATAVAGRVPGDRGRPRARVAGAAAARRRAGGRRRAA